MRLLRWMRRQISLKSNTCTESVAVYTAGISVKVGAHYPGRSVNQPCATDIERWRGINIDIEGILWFNLSSYATRALLYANFLE